MKIEVDISRRFIVFSVVIGLIAVGFAGVYAYTPSSYGHSPNEVDWTQTVNSNVLVNASVGIGTATPVGKMEVKVANEDAIALRLMSGLNSFLDVKPTNTGGRWQTIFDTVNNRDVIFQTGTGNVGIGTTAPSQKLEVSGGIKSSNIIATSGVNASQVCISGDCKGAWPASSGRPTVTYYAWSGNGNKGQTAAHDYCFLIRVYCHDDQHDSRLQGCYIQPANSGNFNNPQAWTMNVLGHGGSSYCSAICFNWS